MVNTLACRLCGPDSNPGLGRSTEIGSFPVLLQMSHNTVVDNCLMINLIVLKACIFDSVLRPFQDYFSSYETGQSVGGGRKRENPEKKHLAHPQAELGLFHMWPKRCSNPHRHSGEMIE